MDYDVIVAGAGPGGCIAARDLARAGFSVAIFDSSDHDNLCHPIVVEAEKTVFSECGVPLPEGEEKPYHQKRMRVFSKNREVFTLEGDHPAISLRLDHFARRLLGYAEEAGAKFYPGHKAVGPLIESGKVVGAKFKKGESDEEVKARLVIDATGFQAALLRKLPDEFGMGFVDDKEDVVIAENRWHNIDRVRAQKAVANGRHYDDEVWNRLGKYGNYSTVYSYLSLEHEKAYILIGHKAAYDNPPISDLVDTFREEQDYYGEELYGGQGPIRVRRSWPKLVADGFMVVGEAACTIIPMHGSGVASAMITGKLAAGAAGNALSKGEATTEALWPYPHSYQTGRGALLAGFDANKLVIESLANDQVAKLMESGAMTSEDLWNAAVPAPMKFSPGSLPGRALAILMNPGLIGKVIKMGSKMSAAENHYTRYPSRWDPAEFAAWRKKEEDIFRDLLLAR